MFLLAQARWSAQDIYLFVAAFGAVGHHLPGMIRAYGDRALFRRFRWRFIFAPIFLLSVCVAFYWWDLKGIILIVFFWGVWHGMMQTYGFCRIYDAKTGSFAALTRRLDFATCATWFAAAVLLSPQRMADTLGNVLRQRRTFHSAVAPAQCATSRLGRCYHRRRFVPVQFFPDVGGRETSQSGKAGACWQRRLLSGGTAITASPTFWQASRCSRSITMCSTSRWSGFTIAAAWKRTVPSAVLCALFFEEAVR